MSMKRNSSRSNSYFELASLATTSFLLALFAALASATRSDASSAADACIGCQTLGLAEAQGSGTFGSCTITIWREISGFAETCGDANTLCNKATCKYDWTVSYRTTGDCSALPDLYYFDELSDEPAADETFGGTSGEDVEIDAGGWGPKRCGWTAGWRYLLRRRASEDPLVWSTVASISGVDGCEECSTVGGG